MILFLDRSLESSYTTAASAIEYIIDFSTINGSSIRRTLSVSPPSTEIWHITKIGIVIEDNTEADDSKFGGGAALTRGIFIKENKSIDRNLVVFRKNGDLIEYFGAENVSYTDKKGAGNYGVGADWHFLEEASAVVKLTGSLGESLDFTIQDDLTGLIEMEIVVQGHVEEL